MSNRDRQNNAADKADSLMALAMSAETAPGPHPTAEQIAAWHESALDAAEASQTERHVAHCDQCYAVWSGLLVLDSNAVITHDNPIERVRQWLSRWLGNRATLQGLAAMMVIAFVGTALSTLLEFGASMPGYNLSLEGNTQFYRSNTQAPVPGAAAEFESGNQFRLILTPDSAVREPVAAKLFLLHDAAIPVDLPTPQAQITSKGAIRIDGEVGTSVTLPPGKAELYVVIAFSDDFPDEQQVFEALAGNDTASHKQWRAWRIPIVVRDNGL